MTQNDSTKTNQPFAVPTAVSEQEAPAHQTPGQLSLDYSLTLGEYVTPNQLAQSIGVSVRTLSRWHAQRIGPPRCSVGKLILYRVPAVRAWMAEREFNPVPLPRAVLSGGTVDDVGREYTACLR
jgi:hypothetical protein